MEAGEILLRSGLLTERQLAQVRAAQNNGTRLDQIAVELGLVAKSRRCERSATRWGSTTSISPKRRSTIHCWACFRIACCTAIRCCRCGARTARLIVATSDPFDLYPLDELSAATGMSVIPVLASRERDRQADQSAAGRRQRNGRRVVGLGRRARATAGRDRDRRLGAVGDGPRGLGRAAGQRDHPGGARVARERHSRRVAVSRPGDPLPHRRHSAIAAGAAGDHRGFNWRSSAA